MNKLLIVALTLLISACESPVRCGKEKFAAGTVVKHKNGATVYIIAGKCGYGGRNFYDTRWPNGELRWTPEDEFEESHK